MREFIKAHPIIVGCVSFFGTCLTFLFLVGTMFSLTLGWMIKLAEDASTTTEDQFTYFSGNKDSKEKLLQIDITGVILTRRLEDPFSLLGIEAVYGQDIKTQLIQASQDDTIKGVLLYIDSPGGTVSGSQAISEGIEHYKKTTGKPVIAHVSGMAASGGYWSAASAKEIYAEPGSFIGSIGVIMGPFKFYDKVLSENDFSYGVSTENGIESFYITAGSGKDMGNPYRKMTKDERDSLQKAIDSSYEIFVSHVARNRELDSNYIKNVLGAYIYDEIAAAANNLSDGIKSYDQTVQYTAALAGMSNDYQILKSPVPDFWSTFFSSSVASFGNRQINNKMILNNKALYLYGYPEQYGFY